MPSASASPARPSTAARWARAPTRPSAPRPTPKAYHDQYSINESIEDGTTLPLYYTLVPTDIWVDKLKLEAEFADLLDEFWDIVDEEGAGTQEALSRLLQRADKLMAVLKSPQRIDAIAAHIAQHFQENVLPRGLQGPGRHARPGSLRPLQAGARRLPARPSGAPSSTRRTPRRTPT